MQTNHSPISSRTRPKAAKPTRSCASACTAASAPRRVRRISCSATSSTVRAGGSTSSSRCSKASPSPKNAAPSRPLPHLPRVRNHVPVGRALQPAARHRAPRRRQPRQASRSRRSPAHAPAQSDHPPGLVRARCSNWGSSSPRAAGKAAPQSAARCATRETHAAYASCAPHARARRLRATRLSPATNAAAARVLDRLGISLIRRRKPAAAARSRFT